MTCMKRASHVLFVAILLFVVVTATWAHELDEASPQRTVDRTVMVDPVEARGWRAHKRDTTVGDERSSFFIFMRRDNEGEVERIAAEVSRPDSPSFHQYLTRQELMELITPPQEISEPVVSWLRTESMQGEPMHWEQRGDHIKVLTTVRNIEKLFETRMTRFTQPGGRTSRYAVIRSATMPSEIAQKVAAVRGLNELYQFAKIGAYFDSNHKRAPRTTDPQISPNYLKQHYNVSTQLTSTNSQNSQGVVASDDYYDLSSLRTFESYFSLPQATIKNVGLSSCLTGSNPCSQEESDLDVQYITAMGTGVPTLFHLVGNNFVYDWASDVVSGSVPTALVYSISYGIDEDQGTNNWSQEEQMLASIAAMGITVIVASGDGGAAGTFSIVPLNVSDWCHLGGCTHQTTSCAQFIVSANGIELMFPPPYPGTIVPDTSFTLFAEANQACNLAFEMDQYHYSYNVYSSCSCSSLKYGTYDGITFSQFTDNPSRYTTLMASYPAVSAWVTAVGATQIQSAEIVASFETGAAITSGGGFSRIFTRPAWQNEIVTAYLANHSSLLPPSAYFNSAGRAIPDVSLVGHNYLVRTAQGYEFVDGTSASTPTFAGLIALVNSERLSRGLQPLGFLNPLLYQLYAEKPEVFIDVTQGSNKATANFVGIYGFGAAPGWDPATGLGAINFGLWYDELAKINTTNGGGGGGGSPAARLSPFWSTYLMA